MFQFLLPIRDSGLFTWVSQTVISTTRFASSLRLIFSLKVSAAPKLQLTHRFWMAVWKAGWVATGRLGISNRIWIIGDGGSLLDFLLALAIRANRRPDTEKTLSDELYKNVKRIRPQSSSGAPDSSFGYKEKRQKNVCLTFNAITNQITTASD